MFLSFAGKRLVAGSGGAISLRQLRSMKVKALAIEPPASAEGCPRVWPELLAASLARYSRSNKGIEEILREGKEGAKDQEKVVDRILRFADYGHASIADLTGGIPVTMDGISMWLAMKIFEVSPQAGGQESSTRYIKMDESGVVDWGAGECGAPSSQWKAVMKGAFESYNREVARLEELALLEPERVRMPAGVKPEVAARLRKNYALDRARYFLPMAARTNVALVQSARAWAQTLTYLSSMFQPEALELAEKLREELMKFSPRLLKHSFREESHRAQILNEANISWQIASENLPPDGKSEGVWGRKDEVEVSLAGARLKGLPFLLEGARGRKFLEDSLEPRANRYGYCGLPVRAAHVTVTWNNMALGDVRDLNRHRTGFRYSPLVQTGFYLPPEINPKDHEPFLSSQQKLYETVMFGSEGRRKPRVPAPCPISYPYTLMLGSQTPFAQSVQLDKFVYQAELRTGLGAHFRYADHMRQAVEALYEQCPEMRGLIRLGEAEPE